MTPRSRLRNAKITSIHVVDKGDNPEAKFAMFKSAPEEEITDSEIQELIDSEKAAEYTANFSGESRNLLENFVDVGRRLLGSNSSSTATNANYAISTGTTTVPPNWQIVTGAPEPAPPETQITEAVEAIDKAGRKMSASRRKTLEEVAEKITSMLTETEGATESTQKGDGMTPLDDKIREGLPDEVKTYLEDLEKNQKEPDTEPEENPLYKGMSAAQVEFFKAQHETIAKLQLEREERDYIEKSKAYGQLPVNPAELGPVLRRVAKGTTTDKDEEYLTEIFASMNTMLKNSELFTEAGRTASASSGSAEVELRQKAAKVAAEQKVDRESAFAKILRDPEYTDLVKRYYEEVSS